MKLHTSFAVVAASVLASVTATSFLTRATGRAPSLPATPAVSSELTSRLTALERRVDELAARSTDLVLSPSAAAPERVPVAAGHPADPGDVASRLVELEGRLARLQTELEPAPELSPAALEAREREAEREREEAVARAQRDLLDDQATVEAKLAAHELLRRVPDAYTPEMIAELVEIGAGNVDPEARADVWRFFDGSTHLPEIVPHLLEALSFDVDPAVRDEASETLGNYANDPEVLAALRWAAEHDASPRVRRKASRTLAEWSWIVSER